MAAQCAPGEPIPLDVRYIGDDWVFHASTTDDVSDWTNPVVEIRTGRGPEYTLVASSQGPYLTVDLDGDSLLNVTPTNFAIGQFTALVRRSATRLVDARRHPFLILELSVEAVSLNGRRTVGTFRFQALPQVAVETAP